MVGALFLLLAALGLLLYKDRNFWFPGTQEAEDQLQPPATDQTASPALRGTPAEKALRSSAKGSRKNSRHAKLVEDSTPADASDSPLTTVSQRTVLPPLEVEVVAANMHHKIRPGDSSVPVDLKPGSTPQPLSDATSSAGAPGTPATVSNATERVQMSTDTTEIVSHSVTPGYPLLARQMKVQGSVILSALIGRDGLIQDLRVVSGPPILANAAQEAVKQWHFKPHYQGSETVETQARITVNFTISTN
jgi:TonB family protein